MKKILCLSITVILMFCASSIFATFKIGIVDMQKLIYSDPHLTVWRNRIQNRLKPRSNRIIALRKVLLTDINKLKKLSATKALTCKKLKTRISAEAQQLRTAQEKFQHDLLVAQRKAIAAITNDIQVAIGKVAARKKIDLVLKRSSVLLYNRALRGSDMTPAVSKRLKLSSVLYYKVKNR
jgi:Skp family chaperone for outer membrane proteins